MAKKRKYNKDYVGLYMLGVVAFTAMVSLLVLNIDFGSEDLSGQVYVATVSPEMADATEISCIRGCDRYLESFETGDLGGSVYAYESCISECKGEYPGISDEETPEGAGYVDDDSTSNTIAGQAPLR